MKLLEPKNKKEFNVKKYIKTMSRKQKCRWLAFIKALELIDSKAKTLGVDILDGDLPNNKIFTTYIEPEADQMEWLLNQADKKAVDKFFLDFRVD